MPSGSHSAQSLRVTVIADNRETIDGLHAYLQGAGVVSHATRTLDGAKALQSTTSAVVLFPDEFRANDVVSRISSLRAARPRLLLVVVTSTPQRLRPALDPDGHSRLPIVLPRPSFGWVILDAIRGHARSELP